jgi:hypothetical protein
MAHPLVAIMIDIAEGVWSKLNTRRRTLPEAQLLRLAWSTSAPEASRQAPGSRLLLDGDQGNARHRTEIVRQKGGEEESPALGSNRSGSSRPASLADRTSFIKEGDDVVTGIRAIASPGPPRATRAITSRATANGCSSAATSATTMRCPSKSLTGTCASTWIRSWRWQPAPGCST